MRGDASLAPVPAGLNAKRIGVSSPGVDRPPGLCSTPGAGARCIGYDGDMSSPDDPKSAPAAAPHRRRPRYRGTHPRRFEERYKELAPERYPEIEEHVRAQGRTPAGGHVPILVAEVMEALAPAPGQIVLDGTLGHGGHAREFLTRIVPGGRLIGLDVDSVELARTAARLADAGPVTTIHGNFAGVGAIVGREAPDGCDILFVDLGVSSMQLDNPERGFSYKQDGPLDMRMDPRQRTTAADLLASLTEEELAEALNLNADEPKAAGIARAIVKHRARAPLRTTRDLTAAVLEAKGLAARWRPEAGPGRTLHPAALTFQALRMLVNEEPAKLAQFLRDAPWCVKPGGRIGVISFHSGEDRLVKHAFRDGFRAGTYDEWSDTLIRPGPEERRDNPRSAPARFRFARRAPAV